MKASTRINVIEALRQGSVDPKASKEARAEAARQMRNQIALAKKLKED